MTKKKALDLIKKKHPKTPAEFRDIGLPLRYINEGGFRSVYQIGRLPLVVKFPNHGLTDAQDGIDHTNAEVRKIRRAARKVPLLRKHLPDVLYHNKKHGVVVMPYYKTKPDVDCCLWLIKKLVGKLGIRLGDVGAGNARATGAQWGAGDLKIIDLGY